VDQILNRVEILLLIAALVAIVARRLHVPSSVGLVVAGGALAFFDVSPGLDLTRDLIYNAFLPPLIFEAAIDLKWKELWHNFGVVLLLASAGVLVSAGVTAAGMRYIAGWPVPASLLFGSLIAATDPVSVIALFREAGLRGRLRLLVEAESLFNDSTAAILFGTALAFAAAGTGGGAAAIGLDILRTIGGAIVVGCVVAGVALLLAGRTTDHLVEITFTTVAAYGSFILAEQRHFSGVLACLTAGLIVGNLGVSMGAISHRGREAVEGFWAYAAFVVNSLIFLLIGMREAREDFLTAVASAVVAIPLVLAARAVAIYPLCAVIAPTRHRVERRHQHVLFWGGLRGALALALALGLPPDVAFREQIVRVTFAVVAFSLIVQGSTMRPLLRWLGQLPRADATPMPSPAERPGEESDLPSAPA
jgi:Na+:H+ antiporter